MSFGWVTEDHSRDAHKQNNTSLSDDDEDKSRDLQPAYDRYR